MKRNLKSDIVDLCMAKKPDYIVFEIINQINRNGYFSTTVENSVLKSRKFVLKGINQRYLIIIIIIVLHAQNHNFSSIFLELYKNIGYNG